MSKWRNLSSMYRGYIYLAILLLCMVVAFLYVNQQSDQEVANNEDHWVYFEKTVLENHIGLVGKIESEERRTIFAPFEGRVNAMQVSYGDAVNSGQTLGTIDTTQLDIKIREAHSDFLKQQSTLEELKNWKNSSEVTQARRAFSSAEISLQNTLDELDKAQHLFNRGIIPRNEVEALERQVRSQRLDVNERREDLKNTIERGTGVNLKVAEMQKINSEINYRRLSDLRRQRSIVAPFDGIILPLRQSQTIASQALPQTGMSVSQGAALFDIASLESLIATTSIEEGDLNQITVGMPVSVTGGGFPSATLHGTIKSIGAQAVQEGSYDSSSTYEVTVAIKSPNTEIRRLIRLGMTANLNIVTYLNQSGIAVPPEAIFYTKDGNAAVLYRKELTDEAEEVSVEVGRAMPIGVEIFGINEGHILLP